MSLDFSRFLSVLSLSFLSLSVLSLCSLSLFSLCVLCLGALSRFSLYIFSLYILSLYSLHSLSVLSLFSLKVTNKTFYESELYPDGELFAKQYQTLSIEHVCPSGGWFPKLWGAGVRVTAVEVVVGVVGVAVVVDVF